MVRNSVPYGDPGPRASIESRLWARRYFCPEKSCNASGVVAPTAIGSRSCGYFTLDVLPLAFWSARIHAVPIHEQTRSRSGKRPIEIAWLADHPACSRCDRSGVRVLLAVTFALTIAHGTTGWSADSGPYYESGTQGQPPRRTGGRIRSSRDQGKTKKARTLRPRRMKRKPMLVKLRALDQRFQGITRVYTDMPI